MFIKSLISCVTAMVAAVASTGAQADVVGNYPSKPIQIIYPWAAGSGETTIRALAEGMSARLKQPVVIDFRPGASTIIGASYVARAPADGYTLLFGSSTTFSINPSVYPKLAYDPIKDFTPVSRVTSSSFFVFANPKLPIKTLGDFIALAKSRPGELSYATPGVGSVPHLSIERLSQETGIKLIHVPYKGNGPLMTDVSGGHVDLSFSINAYPFIKENRVRGLAVSGDRRSSALPELPTVAESGVKNYSAAVWFGIVAPAGTPAVIVKKLNDAIRDTLAQPGLVAKLADQGIDVSSSTPGAFAAQIKDETPIWERVIKTAGISAGD